MYNNIVWTLVLALSVYAMFFFVGLFRRNEVLNALKKDAYGYIFVVISIITLIATSFVKEDQIDLFLTFVSGVSLGIGVLVGLPKKATELALDWRFVVGSIFAVGGLWVVWNYSLSSLTAGIEKAWPVFAAYLDPSQLFGILGVLALAIGRWIFRTIKKS